MIKACVRRFYIVIKNPCRGSKCKGEWCAEQLNPDEEEAGSVTKESEVVNDCDASSV